MPSHRADVAPTKVRRQRSGRTGELPAISADPATSLLRTALPPGVIDTRPAGVRVIDIRETEVALGFEPAAEAPLPDERPIDTQWVKDRFRAAEGASPRGTVPVPEGFELRNGVLDTRPKGLALDEDDVEGHFAGAVMTGPALPLFSSLVHAPAADPRGADDEDLFTPVVEPPAVDRVPARARRPRTASIPLADRAPVVRAGDAVWVGASLPTRPRPLFSDRSVGDLDLEDLDEVVVPEFVPDYLVDERLAPAPGLPDGLPGEAHDLLPDAAEAYDEYFVEHPGTRVPFEIDHSAHDVPAARVPHRYGSAASWMAPGAPTFETILGANALSIAAAQVQAAEAERQAEAEAGVAAEPQARAASRKSAESPFVRRSELRKREAARTSRKAPTSSLSVPRVGIASALGLATIAAPLTGVLTMPTDVPTLPSTAVIAQAGLFAQPVPVFPQVSVAPVAAVEDARLVSDESLSSAVPEALAAPRTLLVTGKASRSNERSVLPGCTGVIPSGYDNATNGQLPKALLCTLWDKDFSLRADAAVAFAKLNVAYNQKFGHNICIVDAYRTLSEQYTIKRLRGGYAATPGTSEHGWGLAVDLCGGSSLGGTPTYTWLRANAPLFGWDNPEWARPGGSGVTEEWHWEYLPGEKTGPGGD